MKYVLSLLFLFCIAVSPRSVLAQCDLATFDKVIAAADTADEDKIEYEKSSLAQARAEHQLLDDAALYGTLFQAVSDLGLKKEKISFVIFKAFKGSQIAFSFLKFDQNANPTGIQIWVADLGLDEDECKSLIAHEVAHNEFDSLLLEQIKHSSCPNKEDLKAQIELRTDEAAIVLFPQYLTGLRRVITKHDPDSYLSKRRLQYFKSR